MVGPVGFPGDPEEIDFFKRIKPSFTGQLEYYMLVYQYQLFCPWGDTDVAGYRQKEQKKIERFRETHAPFLNYCASGQTDKDAVFFLRKYYINDGDQEPRPYVRMHDKDPKWMSSYDWILTLNVGFDLYEQFLLLQDAGHRLLFNE